MSLTVSIGWWALPLAITAGSIGWAFAVPAEPSSGPYSFPDVMPLVRLTGAVIASLVAWLIWALLT